MSPSPSQQLARWVSELEFDDLPRSVLDKAKAHVLDTLGCMIGGTRSSFGASLLGATRGARGGGAATGVGIGPALSVETAAFVNGALAHALDYDDTHAGSSCHVSAVVLPAALAVAEQAGRSGRDLLTAYVAGVEAIAAIGSVVPGALHLRGLHPTGVLGPFGAAAAAASLLGTDGGTTAHALGIAGSYSAGTLAYLSNGSSVKPVHAANAARAGVEAVRLARHGITGPDTIFDGRDGIFSAFLGLDGLNFSPVRVLGVDWQMLQTSVKAFPSCLATHSVLQASLVLRREHGLSASDVAGVHALVRERDIPLVLEPFGRRRSPQTAADARFSLPYTAALALSEGAVREDRLCTPRCSAEMDRLIAAFTYEAFAFGNSDAQFSGGVRLTLVDGSVLEKVLIDHPDSGSNPLTAEAAHRKLMDNVGPSLDVPRASELDDLVRRLDDMDHVGPLMAVLGEVPGPGPLC